MTQTASNLKIAVIGLGNIGQVVASNLVKGNRPVIVAGRTLSKAQEFAGRLGKLAQASSRPANQRARFLGRCGGKCPGQGLLLPEHLDVPREGQILVRYSVPCRALVQQPEPIEWQFDDEKPAALNIDGIPLTPR